LFDDILTGLPTTTKAYDVITRNFILANGNSLGPVDNDDGSSYISTHHNFFVWGGGGLKVCTRVARYYTHKHACCIFTHTHTHTYPENLLYTFRGRTQDDFEGHDNEWRDNVIALSQNPAIHNGYDGTVGTPGVSPYVKDGHEHRLINNFIAFFSGDNPWVYAMPICNGTGKSIMGNNTIFSPNGNVSVKCEFSGLHSLAEWQAEGNDLGTTASSWNESSIVDEVLVRAREVLWGH